MITDYFWHENKDMDVEDMWFQQDGVTCNILRENFSDGII